MTPHCALSDQKLPHKSTRSDKRQQPLVDLQLAVDNCVDIPAAAQFDEWVVRTLDKIGHAPKEITVRVVEKDEMIDLNSRYRGKTSATNVLSFPFQELDNIDYPFLGDIVVCFATVWEEAQSQSKPIVAHWAHLIIHGTLHLCGYDHQNDEEAATMEELEKSIMADFGFADPYQANTSVR